MDSLTGYLKFLDSCVSGEGDVKPGNFYTFTYRYKSLRTDGKSGNQFAFYDVKPLIFLYGRNGKTLDALNLHFLPVKVRMEWLDVLEKLCGGVAEGRANELPPDVVKEIGLKTDFAERHYSEMRIAQWRKIDPSKIRELCKWTPGTFGQVDQKHIDTLYFLYNPALR